MGIGGRERGGCREDGLEEDGGTQGRERHRRPPAENSQPYHRGSPERYINILNLMLPYSLNDFFS